MIIYHIVTPEVWEEYKNEKFYEAESLRKENFIHCSFAEQLDRVLQRYYKDADKVLILETRHGKTDGETNQRNFDRRRNLPAHIRENKPRSNRRD
jgi:uncharacterized protein (DUF952 family)